MAWLGQFDDFADCIDTGPSSYRNQNTYNADVNNNNVAQTQIQDLAPAMSMTDTHIVGLVIAKEQPREINKKGADGSSRFLLCFTLRDTTDWYINVTCWGGREYITSLAAAFHWGDIVEVSNAQIQTKPTDGSDSRFKPFTTSQYLLNVSERHSTVRTYQGWDTSQYTSLQHTLVRPPNDFYVLSDITMAGQSLNNEHVNLLAAVKSVGNVKEMVSKKGRNIKRCEVKLYDDTCPSFSLIMWDEEIINQATTWNPGEYVIFAADVKVYLDDFRSAMVATVDSKTIITVNPDTKEAHELYRFAQANPSLDDPVSGFSDDSMPEKDPELMDIQTICTVAELKTLQSELNHSQLNAQFAIVYGFLTSFDIDSDCKDIIRYKCSSCNQILKKLEPVCLNPGCIEGGGGRLRYIVMEYSVIVDITDHTGTVSTCHLYQELAERMITCKAEEYMNGTRDLNYWTDLKWKYLLEKCKFYVKIQKSKARGTTFIRVMSCDRSHAKDHLSYIYKALS